MVLRVQFEIKGDLNRVGEWKQCLQLPNRVLKDPRCISECYVYGLVPFDCSNTLV